MKALLFPALFCLLLMGCRKSNECSSYCLETSIEQFRTSSSICDTGASVKEYFFQGKMVYVFEVGGCMSDSYADVYDQNCLHLGMLGGIAGFTKINGEEFHSHARYKRTLWEN